MGIKKRDNEMNKNITFKYFIYVVFSLAILQVNNSFTAAEREYQRHHMQQYKMNFLHALFVNNISEDEALKICRDLNSRTINHFINEKDVDGFTPLHMAVQKGYTRLADFFLRHGANPNEQNNYGSTPLHLAAIENNARLVNILLYHSARTNIRNNKGEMPYQLTDVTAIRERLMPKEASEKPAIERQEFISEAAESTAEI